MAAFFVPGFYLFNNESKKYGAFTIIYHLRNYIFYACFNNNPDSSASSTQMNLAFP